MRCGADVEQKPYDIRERSFLFARLVVAFCRSAAKRDWVMRRLATQLVDAAGSVGANLEEADEGQSKPDFIAKNYVALKECKEAHFWLRLISVSEPNLASAAKPLIDEARQLTSIVRTIVINAKRNRNRGNH